MESIRKYNLRNVSWNSIYWQWLLSAWNRRSGKQNLLSGNRKKWSGNYVPANDRSISRIWRNLPGSKQITLQLYEVKNDTAHQVSEEKMDKDPSDDIYEESTTYVYDGGESPIDSAIPIGDNWRIKVPPYWLLIGQYGGIFHLICIVKLSPIGIFHVYLLELPKRSLPGQWSSSYFS